MNWIEISETRYTLEIQGIYSELEQMGRNWHLSVGDAVVTKIGGSLSAIDAKAAAEKMLVETFEDAIRELVGDGKQAGITKEIQEAKAVKWNLASETLPELGTVCLVYSAIDGLQVATYKKCVWDCNGLTPCFVDVQDEQPSKVYATHWVELDSLTPSAHTEP